MGGEAAVAGEVMGGDVLGGDAMGGDSSSGALGDPSGGVYLGSPLSYDDDEAIDELPIEGRNNGHIRRKLQEEQQQRTNGSRCIHQLLQQNSHVDIL